MKNTKHIIAFLSGSIAYIFLWTFLSSFGNHYSHPIINENMIAAFTDNSAYKSIEKFKNIYLNLTASVSGTGMKTGGKLTTTEGKMDMSVKNWIISGGIWADEPEVLNSLRHFYDPTQNEGSRYLTDQSRGIMGYVQSAYGVYDNPKIDGVEWAVSHSAHDYTWVQGKIAVKDAFNTADPTKRKELMGKAWRCLGETLHMIADNATPAHVRDDAHPAPLGDSEYFGDPDTFEEYMDYLGQNEKTQGLFKKWSQLPADVNLTNNLKKATTIRELAHILAVYTNTSFFSNQTISGTDSQGYPVVPLSKTGKKYSSPKIDKSMFIGSHFEKNGIKICAQPWWIGLVSNVSEVHIDKPTVESMSTKIIPAAMEGGKNAMRLFIPDVKVYISDFSSDGAFKGSVIHTKDAEYTLPIVYNGPVNILDKKLKIIETVEAKDGKFEGKLKDLSVGEISAFLAVGGIEISSNSVVKSDFVIDSGHIFITGSFDAKVAYSGKVPEGIDKTWSGTKDESLDFYFYKENNPQANNGNISVNVKNDPFQITYNPSTNELLSFSVKSTKTWAVDNWDLDETGSGGGIPAKFFSSPDWSPNYKYLIWTVTGAEALKYVSEAKIYTKQQMPWSVGLIEEKWLTKLQSNAKAKLEVYLVFKKK
ncbi:MAG: hypothetical protein LCH67_03355 [Bacteroidetes bacterium]|nr:hypothetical protein [Bacteroidota bacterium]